MKLTGDQIVAIIIGIVVIASYIMSLITPPKDYNYTYIVEVIYDTDGLTETLEITRDSFKGNPVTLRDQASAGTNCLYISCGEYTDQVICDVRKFTILDTIKTTPNGEWFKNRIRDTK